MAGTVWLQFGLCAVALWVAGVRLSRYADLIAARTGATRSWVGLVLLASVISLPELVTGLSSAGPAHSPDLAIGDVLGSCVFNLVVLVIVDFLYHREPMYASAATGHVLSASFGVVLLGVTGFGIALGALGRSFHLGHVGIVSPILLGFYLVAMRVSFRYEQRQHAEHVEEAVPRQSAHSLRQLWSRYLAWSLVVVAGGA
jgi:cation:H+ antiporter